MSTSKPMQPTGPRNPIAKWIHPSFTNLGNLKPELPNGERVAQFLHLQQVLLQPYFFLHDENSLSSMFPTYYCPI
jgi:hypothetical protein